jgi:hypothetical protein
MNVSPCAHARVYLYPSGRRTTRSLHQCHGPGWHSTANVRNLLNQNRHSHHRWHPSQYWSIWCVTSKRFKFVVVFDLGKEAKADQMRKDFGQLLPKFTSENSGRSCCAPERAHTRMIMILSLDLDTNLKSDRWSHQDNLKASLTDYRSCWRQPAVQRRHLFVCFI